MPTFYVNSVDGDNGDNGTSWALAKATLAGAFAVGAAGDTFMVAHEHAETQESAMTLTCPGTVAAPCYILCANTGTGALASTATISTTATNNMTLSGHAYVYGVTFQCGSSTGNVSMFLGSGAASQNFIFDTCGFSIVATGTTGRIRIGDGTRDCMVDFINCTMKFANTAQRALVRHHFRWIGGSLDVSTAIPTSLFNVEPGYGSTGLVQGVNLSGLTGTLVVAGNNSELRWVFKNCRLHASATAKTATAIIGPGADQIIVDNCASGDTNYTLHHEKYQGTIDHETTLIRTGGASDGTTGFSWKMVGLAAGPTFMWPLESPPIVIWNESVGSEVTATDEFLHDGATNLQDDEIWPEVEYLGTSGYTTSLLARDRMASIIATPADQADSSVEWTTSGMSNPNTQKLTVAFTPAEKGPVVIKVMLAKPSQTVYVCPKVSIA